MRVTRFVIAVGAVALACWAVAQAPFTIVRPVEGARVRETVKIQIPEKSVPEGGYIAIFVDETFIEAIVPDVKNGMYEYLLDTKKKGLSDGQHKIEVVLYGPTGSYVGILDRSSVNVTVANRQQIEVPENGAALKYKLRTGTDWPYKILGKVTLLSISEQQEKQGATASEQLISLNDFLLRYSIDNVYPSGNALLRQIPIATESGSVVFQDLSGGDPYAIQASDVGTWYSEMTPTGNVVWEGGYGFMDPMGSAPSARPYMTVLPLPSLPHERHRAGDRWSAEALFATSYHGYPTSEGWAEGILIPCEATLVAFEWEQGHPCAHIEYKFAFGQLPDTSGKLVVQGSEVEKAEAAFEQHVWFAMDLGTVVKSTAALTVQVDTSQMGGGMTGGFDPDLGGGPSTGPTVGPSTGGGMPGPGVGPSPGPGPGRTGPGVAPPTGGITRGGGQYPRGGVRGGTTGPPSGGAGSPGKVRLRYYIEMVLVQ